MNRDNRNSRLLTGFGAAMIAALLLSGCAQTVAPSPNIIQRASGETPCSAAAVRLPRQRLLAAHAAGRRIRPKCGAPVH